MGRRALGDRARTVVVASRVTAAEAAEMDRRRGSLSRADWLRFLHVQAVKSDVKFAEQVRIKRPE